MCEDVTVSKLGPSEILPAAILKASQTRAGKDSLRRQAAVLQFLHREPKLLDWLKLIPMSLALNEIDDQTYLIESSLVGINGKVLLANDVPDHDLLHEATLLISEFHQRTAKITTIDANLGQRLIDERIDALRQITAVAWSNEAKNASLDALKAELYRALVGRTLPVSWVHGNYMLENILFDARTKYVTGIINWEMAESNDLSQLDLVFLILSTRMLQAECTWRDVILKLGSNDGWTEQEKRLLALGDLILQGQSLPWRVAVMLCWLRQVQTKVLKSNYFASSSLWIAKNVDAVLQTFSRW